MSIIFRLNGFIVYSDGSATADGGFTGSFSVGADDDAIISGGLTVTDGDLSISSDSIIMDTLPILDPSVAGQLWNNSGVVNISNG